MILKSYFNFDMSPDCVFQVPAQISYNTHGILAHNGHNAGTLSAGTETPMNAVHLSPKFNWDTLEWELAEAALECD